MEIAIGDIFGCLTVIGIGERSPSGHKQWICRCSCGAEKPYRKWLLVSGEVRSCGCKSSEHYSQTFYAKEAAGIRRIAPRGWALGERSEEHRKKLAEANKKHGMKGQRVYTIWCQMLGRCFNEKNGSFKRYGGRGISVCERWLEFQNFLADMGHPPSDIHSIERINNNGNYEPGNCKWATDIEQSNNRRSNKYLEYQGELYTASQLARKLNVNAKSLQQRLRRGKSVEEAVALAIAIGPKK